MTLPWLGHFQLPCPSPLLGLSALHKNHQAKQEQNESCKIRHFVNVYDARSCFPVTSSGKNLPGLNHWFSLLPRDRASWKGCEGMPGQTDFPDLIFDTDTYTILPALLPRTWHKHQSFALPAALWLVISQQVCPPVKLGFRLVLKQLWLKPLYKKKKN